VLYQPDVTPSRSDSSVLTWRGERFCMYRAFKIGSRPRARGQVWVHSATSVAVALWS